MGGDQMRFADQPKVATILAVLVSLAVYFGVAYSTSETAAAQSHGCSGECACIWSPDMTHQHCEYYPNASECNYDSDCCSLAH